MRKALLSGAFLLPGSFHRGSGLVFGLLPLANPSTFPNSATPRAGSAQSASGRSLRRGPPRAIADPTLRRCRARRRPIRPLGPESVSPAGNFQILPAGKRPYYCLAVAGMASDAATYVPEGLDYCELIREMVATRDSGLTSYAPLTEASATGLGVSTPVYRSGVKLSTAQGRHHAFLGWLGERIQPRVLLQTALAGHPGAAVVFRFNTRYAHVAFASGKPPTGAQSATIPVAVGREMGLLRDEGWTMQSFSASTSASVFNNDKSLIVLVGGCLLSVLVGLLISVLGTGRMRALALVREKTR